MDLILASGSAYRRELLSRLRLPFRVEIPDVDETPRAGERPCALAVRLALAKAVAVGTRFPGAVVIGSDQVATLDGLSAIGKPGTLERARTQLALASGRTMQFHTAFAVVAPHRAPIEERVDVAVGFAPLTTCAIERYLELEQPFDCAGAAKCEGLGISLLEWIRTDDPTALIGLPLIRLSQALRTVGIDPLSPSRALTLE